MWSKGVGKHRIRKMSLARLKATQPRTPTFKPLRTLLLFCDPLPQLSSCAMIADLQGSRSAFKQSVYPNQSARIWYIEFVCSFATAHTATLMRGVASSLLFGSLEAAPVAAAERTARRTRLRRTLHQHLWFSSPRLSAHLLFHSEVEHRSRKAT